MPVSIPTKRAGSRGQVNGVQPDQKENGEDYYYGSYSRQVIFKVAMGVRGWGAELIKMFENFLKILQPRLAGQISTR